MQTIENLPESVVSAQQYGLSLKASFVFSRFDLECLASLPIRFNLVEYTQYFGHGEPLALENLQKFPRLRSLDLQYNRDPIAKEFMPGLHRACPHLLSLNLSHFPLEGFHELVSNTPQLIDVDLSGTRVANPTVAHLAANCTQLRALRLRNCEQVTEGAIASLANCRHLKILDLGGCSKISSQAAKLLANPCPFSLHELTLPASMASGPLVRAIAQAHPDLVKLSFSTVFHNVSNEDLLFLARCCPNLVALNTSNGELIADQGVIALADGCPWLEKVELNRCPLITAASVDYLLSKCPNMREIWLRDSRRIEIAAARNLAHKYPHVKIYQEDRNPYAK